MEEEENFDYEQLWDKQEEKIRKKLVEELPKGLPRKGLKGKPLKIKGDISRSQLKAYNQN